MFFFSLIPEGHLCQVQNSWLTVLYFQRLINIVSLFSGFLGFRQGIRCHLNWSFSKGNALFLSGFLSQIFIFIFHFQKFNYYVSWYEFPCVYLVWVSFSLLAVSFAKFGEFSAIVSSNILSAPPPVTPLFLRLQYYCWIFCYYPAGPWSFVFWFCFALSLFSLCFSIFLSSSSLILTSVITTLLSLYSKWFFKKFCYCIFQFYNFYLILFHNVYFFAEIFFSHLLQENL